MCSYAQHKYNKKMFVLHSTGMLQTFAAGAALPPSLRFDATLERQFCGRGVCVRVTPTAAATPVEVFPLCLPAPFDRFLWPGNALLFTSSPTPLNWQSMWEDACAGTPAWQPQRKVGASAARAPRRGNADADTHSLTKAGISADFLFHLTQKALFWQDQVRGEIEEDEEDEAYEEETYEEEEEPTPTLCTTHEEEEEEEEEEE